MEIKRVGANRAAELLDISKQTFFDAFAEQNSAADMEIYASNNLTLLNIEKELTTIGSEFYFASENDQIIGYLKLNQGTAQTEFKTTDSLEIERIYVLAKYQGKKAGERLVKFAVQQAIENYCSFIWLGVWENNHNAIRFYQQHGFNKFSTHHFMLGNDKQTDVLMRKLL